LQLDRIIGNNAVRSDNWDSDFGANGNSYEDFGAIKLKNVFKILTTKLHWKMIDGLFSAEGEKRSI